MEPLEVLDHYGDTIVVARYDGSYDRPASRTGSS
jgi:hypothetical protein